MAPRFCTLRAFALLGLAACGDGTSAPADDNLVDAGVDPVASREFADFDATVKSFLETSGLKGASAIVLDREDGVVHEAAYGEHAPGRIYLIASASKILSAGVLMHLADRGVVDLDAPIGTYVKDWGEGKADLSLAQLLSNSSGMLGLGEMTTYGPYLCQFLPASNLSTCAKNIYAADDAETRVPADSKFRYGGGAWQLAGGIAEAASKKSWDALLEETYRTPCGAKTLGYGNQYGQAFGEAGVDGAWAYPSFVDGSIEKLQQTVNPNIEGGGYASVADYGKILLMHLRGGMCGEQRALSEAAVARMQADRIGETYEGSTRLEGLEGYGFGWFLDRAKPGVVVDPGAYGAMAWIDNQRGYAAFVAIESDSDHGHELRNALTPELEALFTP